MVVYCVYHVYNCVYNVFPEEGHITLHVLLMSILMTCCPLLLYLLKKEQQHLVCIIDVSPEEGATSNIYIYIYI